jgi:ribosomal protein S18 acetylase RimI-like enzyme
MIVIQKQPWHDFTRVIIMQVHESKPVAVASVQIDLYEKEQCWGGTAYIYGLWVDKDIRRRGIAKTLLMLVEKYAKQNGHKSVILEWNLNDTPVEVLHWYIRCGYEGIEFKDNSKRIKLEKKF